MPASVRHVVDRKNAETIRQVLIDVRNALQALGLDDCDTADIEELIDKIAAELDSPQPKVATLSLYLNSLARSLRSEPQARTVVMELDAAMRDAQLPRSWEH
jgi:hypothetical protein